MVIFIFRTTRQYKQEEITEIVSENEFLQGRHRKNREIIHQKIQERLKSRDVQVFLMPILCLRVGATPITDAIFRPLLAKLTQKKRTFSQKLCCLDHLKPFNLSL